MVRAMKEDIIAKERQIAFNYFMENAKIVDEKDMAKFLRAVSRLSDEDFLAMVCFLFPEFALNPRLKKKIQKRIEKLEENGRLGTIV